MAELHPMATHSAVGIQVMRAVISGFRVREHAEPREDHHVEQNLSDAHARRLSDVGR